MIIVDRHLSKTLAAPIVCTMIRFLVGMNSYMLLELCQLEREDNKTVVSLLTNCVYQH